MPERKVLVMTENGEYVSDITVCHARKRAPFAEWAIVPCLSCASFAKLQMPVGVEAEIVLILLLRAHDTTRTGELAKILNRDNATVSRALSRLRKKGWVLNPERGEWEIRKTFAYYGRWFTKKYGRHAP